MSLSSYHATDPRDEVYGISGILRQHSNIEVASIWVAYAKSLAEIYTEVAAMIVRQNQNLVLLEEVSWSQASKYDSQFPSWVLRWDCTCGAYGLPFIDRLDSKARFPDSLRDSLGIGCSSGFEVEGRRLLVYGTMYRKTASIFPLASYNLHTTLFQCWPHLADGQSSQHNDRDKLLEVGWTLSAEYGTRIFSFSELSAEQRNKFLADFCDSFYNSIPHAFFNRPVLPGSADELVIDGNIYKARDGRSLFQM